MFPIEHRAPFPSSFTNVKNADKPTQGSCKAACCCNAWALWAAGFEASFTSVLDPHPMKTPDYLKLRFQARMRRLQRHTAAPADLGTATSPPCAGCGAHAAVQCTPHYESVVWKSLISKIWRLRHHPGSTGNNEGYNTAATIKPLTTYGIHQSSVKVPSKDCN